MGVFGGRKERNLVIKIQFQNKKLHVLDNKNHTFNLLEKLIFMEIVKFVSGLVKWLIR